MGWKKIWARLAPKVISLSTSMEGTSPYTTEKSEAISSGDKDTLRNIQDKEGSLARKAAVAQLGLAVAPQILPVIANPATASTTAGAVAATGLDAAGLVGGLNQLNNYWNNRKNLTWNDTPGIILSGLSLVPGSSQLTNAKNWGTAANSISNLVKPITGTVKANALARHIRINHPNLVQNLSQTGEHSQSLARIWNNYTGQNIKIDPKLIENAEKVQAALLYGPEKTLVPSARLYGFGTKNLSRMGIDDSVIQTISGTASKYPSQASKKLIAAQNLPDNVTFYSGPKIKSLQQIGHGQEHEVYQYGDDVLKFRFHRNPISYSPHNKAYSTLTDELTSTGAYKYKGPAGEFIPERQYLGVGIDDGGSLVPVFKERFVEGQTPTQQQLNEAFTKYGINYDGVKQVTFKDGSVAQDVNPKNVKLVDGKPIIIDPIAGSLYNPNFRHYKFKSKQVLSGSRPISEAERLGIPKGERSNPKALEDPYYWGYQQWNNRYNTAVNSENIQEAQRLRDLHFKIKAPNAPQYNFYHGTFNKERPFYIFEPQSNNELFFHFSPYKDTAEKFMGIAKTRNENGRLITAKLNIQHPTTVTDSGWWNWYRIPEANPRISKMLRMDGPTAGQYYSNLLLKEPSMSEANGKMMDMLGNDAFMYKNYTEDTGRISVAIPRPSQIKLADPITRTDTGEIIPIVKRDNFRNPDIRYKQGGIIKLQNAWTTIPLGGDYLEYLQNTPEVYGGSIQSAVKTEKLPEKFHGSQQAARTYAEGYQKGAKPVTKAINNAGQKIFNTTKNVAMFVPGPIGAITWLGQMGADTANGEYSKVVKDLAAAALVGAGLKGAQVGAKAIGRNLAGRGINIPWLDAHDYSALRNEYFDRAFRKINHKGPLRYAVKYDLPTNGNFGVTEYKAIDALSGKEIGKLGTIQNLEHLGNKIFARTKSPQYVDNINGSDWNKGISRTLYNAALNDRPTGLISGESLREPIKTEAVWKHFPYKVIRYNGIRPEGKTGRVVNLRKQERFVPILDESALKIRPLFSKSISPQEAATTYHGLQNTFDDISQIPEPLGIGYSGYTPTKNVFNQRFVDDVIEAVKMANARGPIEEPKTTLFDIDKLKEIGRGAEHIVYEHPTDPNKVLKIPYGGERRGIQNVLDYGKWYISANDPLYNMRLNIEGLTKENQYGFQSPVFSQYKLQTLPDYAKSLEEAKALRLAIDKFALRIGADPIYNWKLKLPVNNVILENTEFIRTGGKDFKPDNIGFTKDGLLMGYDLHKQGGIIKGQNGRVIGWSPVPFLAPKWMFELVAKRSNGAQTKSIPTIIRDVVTGRDKSFYNEDNINGSNEIDTYLYGKPYNSEFTGNESVGPDYTNYINKNYPNRNIKTYNAHFGDTLYIDDKAKPLVEKQLNNGEVVGGSMGRYAHAPSYIVTKEEGRPYDAGGHLIKFGKDNNGNIVANMSDIYDFLPEDFEEKYNQTENPSWTRNLANNIGTPFIVRQNNIPVRFKEIVPEYKTDKQRELGEFLSQWGNTYDLKLPLSLSDEQIQEIFDGRDYGDDILDFMISKGYIKPVYKSGGIVKGQNGFLNTWQKAYNSKFGKGLRNFLNGTDNDLTDEEYLEKHGYNKPVGSIGILGALVAPEWEGLEAIPVAENFGRAGIAKGVPKTAQMRPTKIKNFEGVPQVSKVEPVKELTKFKKFLQRPIKEQDDIVRFWNGEKFSNMEMLKLDKKAYQQFKNWINK